MNNRKSNGFTLIEILVVIAILGILGFILTDILTQVLRGQNKINIVNRIKQNGQLVLDNLSNEIRSAEKVICVGKNTNNTGSSLNDSIVIFKSGNYTRFRFIPPTINTNGYFTSENFTKDSFEDITDQNMCSRDIDFVTPINLTDKDTINGISIDYDVSQPIFKKQAPQPGFSDIILIRFRANGGVSAGKTSETTVSEGGVLFTTAVAVRGEK